MKVVYQGASDDQVNFGGGSDPRDYLVVGHIYEVDHVDVRSWHTRFYLKDYKDIWFNSVCFREFDGPQVAAVLALSIVSVTSFAKVVTIDTDKLTPEVSTQVQAIVEQPITKEVAAVRNEISAWGELGKGIGVALIAAAKEVGVTANEFATTPLGKIATAIIVYKMVGSEIIGLAFGVLVLSIGFYWGIRLIRSGTKYKYEIKPKSVLFGLWTFNERVIVEELKVTSDDANVVLLGCVMLVVSCIIFAFAV